MINDGFQFPDYVLVDGNVRESTFAARVPHLVGGPFERQSLLRLTSERIVSTMREGRVRIKDLGPHIV